MVKIPHDRTQVIAAQTAIDTLGNQLDITEEDGGKGTGVYHLLHALIHYSDAHGLDLDALLSEVRRDMGDTPAPVKPVRVKVTDGMATISISIRAQRRGAC